MYYLSINCLFHPHGWESAGLSGLASSLGARADMPEPVEPDWHDSMTRKRDPQEGKKRGQKPSQASQASKHSTAQHSAQARKTRAPLGRHSQESLFFSSALDPPSLLAAPGGNVASHAVRTGAARWWVLAPNQERASHRCGCGSTVRTEKLGIFYWKISLTLDVDDGWETERFAYAVPRTQPCRSLTAVSRCFFDALFVFLGTLPLVVSRL